MTTPEEIGIGDLAEQMLLEQMQNIKEGKEEIPSLQNTALSPTQVPNQMDISQVVVPDDVMTQWTGKTVNTPRVAKPKPIVETVERVGSTKKLREVVTQLTEAIQAAQSLILELTTVGMIGTNMAGATSTIVRPNRITKVIKRPVSKKKKKRSSENIIANALKEYQKK